MSAARNASPRFLRLKVALVILATLAALPFILVGLFVGGKAERRS